MVLTIGAECETDDDILDMIGQGPSPLIMHGVVIGVGGYSRNRIWQQVLFTASRHESNWSMNLAYSCPAVGGDPLGPPPQGFKSGMTRLEGFLGSKEFRLLDFRDISVFVQYRLEAADVATVIPMPILRNDDPAAAFTEVRGIKLAKDGPLSDAYVADLEILGGVRKIGLTLRFGIEGRFDNNTAKIALQRAQSIESRLIFLKERQDG